MSISAFLTKILFVGHSLVGPDLPPMTQTALAAAGMDAVVEAQIINGSPLGYNYSNSATAEGTDGRARLSAAPGVDILILTEAQPFPAHVEFSDTAGQVINWASLARATNPNTKVFLYETWPSRRTGPGLENADDPYSGASWRDRIASDLDLYNQVMRAAKDQGQPVALIPAGQAMANLEDAIARGEVADLTSIDAMFSDDIHLSYRGKYFVAMVHVAALTGASPEGLPAKLTRSWPARDQIITDEMALAFQRIAHQTVTTVNQQAAMIPAPSDTALTKSGAATPAVPPPPVVPGPQTIGTFPPITNPNLALGLAGVDDWSVQQPFLDVMKTARPWIGHLPGQWGGWGMPELLAAGALQENGWPNRIPKEITSIATLVLTDLPDTASGIAGTYDVQWSGQGEVRLEGRAQNVVLQDRSAQFDFTPGEGGVIVTILATDPADPIRDISVVRQDRRDLWAKGAVFNPDWLARIQGAKMLRFMDWLKTNNSTLAAADERPRPTDYSWALRGVPIEIILSLANTLKADPWITLPHLANDDLVAEMARLTRGNLDPNLRAWVEYSNEVWNWQFDQAHFAEAQGKALWGADGLWLEYYGHRSSQIADIWAKEYADSPDRLVRVIAVQTGALGIEEQVFNPRYAPRDQPWSDSFDAYAVTGYVAALLGSEPKMAMVKSWLAESHSANPASPYDLAYQLALQELRDGSISNDPEDTLARLLDDILPYQAKRASELGLDLVMYEGGTHVVGYGPTVDDPELTRFFTQLNYSTEMGLLYKELLAGWARFSTAPFNAFVDVYAPGKWGSWGALRHLGDVNPRWTALAEGN